MLLQRLESSQPDEVANGSICNILLLMKTQLKALGVQSKRKKCIMSYIAFDISQQRTSNGCDILPFDSLERKVGGARAINVIDT